MSNKPPGLFISIEGADDSGKSTQTLLLKESLSRSRKVVATREPGGTPVAERLRNILLEAEEDCFIMEEEIALLTVARSQHIRKFIVPALETGTCVLTDRFIDSTIVYQVLAAEGAESRKKDLMKWALKLHEDLCKNFFPDLTFFLDVPPEVCLQRQKTDRKVRNRFDKRSLAFYQSVQKGFMALLEKSSGRIIRIDGEKPPEAVREEILSHISRRLSKVSGEET